jgi:hypothetical protein
MTTLQQGDKCWVRLDSGKKHYGVVVGFNKAGPAVFVHNTTRDGVVQTDRRGFAGRRDIRIEASAHPTERASVAARAQGWVGRDYDLLRFNCEHLANEATTGTRYSTQLQTAGWTATVLGSLLTAMLAAMANTNGTRVDHSGYRRNANGQFASRRWW